MRMTGAAPQGRTSSAAESALEPPKRLAMSLSKSLVALTATSRPSTLLLSSGACKVFECLVDSHLQAAAGLCSKHLTCSHSYLLPLCISAAC